MLDETTHIYNKATLLLSKGQWKKAIPLFRDVLKMVESRECLVNLGNCYRLQGDYIRMEDCYTRALAPGVVYVDPKSELHALNNLGLTYYAQGFDDKAIELYTRAIKKDPKFWETWWNCSTAVLRKASTSGDMATFRKGWEMYNARFLKTPPVKVKNNKEGLEYWRPGEKVDSLIVLTEQGLGDSIMFGRYVPLLREFASKVYVQCDPSLYSVFSDFECVSDAIETDAAYAYPICSLASCFDYMPSGDWLKGKYGKREFPSGFNIGIVHAGSPSHTNDRNRSVNIHRFHALAPYANLYSLSPGFKSTKYVKSLDISSWEETACAINGLDLVITVDTSVAHMAGSLGARTWMLQPTMETDFRWGNGDRSVWYQSVEVFRNPGDWDVVFENVLREVSNEKR